MSRRGPNTVLVVCALVAACAVYGPSDLTGPDSTFPIVAGRANSSGGAGATSRVSGGFSGAFTNGAASGGRGFGGASGGASASFGGASQAASFGGASHGTSGGAGTGTTARGGATGGVTAGGSGTVARGGDPGVTPTGAGGSDAGGAGVSEAAGAGGADDGSGGFAAAGAGGEPATVPTVAPELIDDMEDNNPFVLIHEGRDGLWYTSFGEDGSADPPASKITMALLTDAVNAAPDSTRAFHFKGSGGTEWGAMAAFDFRFVSEDPKLPYDASSYEGISFYAKAESAPSTILVRLPIVDTSADADGACTAVTNGCEDHYTAHLSLTTSWKRYVLGWSGASSVFTQEPWGYLCDFDASQLVSVQFVISVGQTADFWIDDIAFVP